MKSDIMSAIKQICAEKSIPIEAVLEALDAAMAVAYRRDFADKDKNWNIKAKFDPETGDTQVFDVKLVVEDQELPTPEELMAAKEEGPKFDPETGLLLPEQKRFNPKMEVMISEAKKVKHDAQLGEEIWTPLPAPTEFGRLAALTAKQTIMQKLREAERGAMFQEFKGKEGDIVTAAVQRQEGRMVIVDLGHAAGLMPPDEQIRRERYLPGMKVKVYIASVSSTPKGPEIIVSRAHPEMVRKLFGNEVPEIANGSVEIKSIAREAGGRTKIAVASNDPGIDPIGSCVGQRGSRVQVVISELGGEKIDIVEYSDDQVAYITGALAPASVESIEVDEATHSAKVKVAEDQLSLAIGRAGQNVRLASRLTGWNIDIIGPEGKKIEEKIAMEQPVATAKETEEEIKE
ncbi:MAG: transcription termination factor NusA [bacterium]